MWSYTTSLVKSLACGRAAQVLRDKVTMTGNLCVSLPQNGRLKLTFLGLVLLSSDTEGPLL